MGALPIAHRARLTADRKIFGGSRWRRHRGALPTRVRFLRWILGFGPTGTDGRTDAVIVECRGRANVFPHAVEAEFVATVDGVNHRVAGGIDAAGKEVGE